MDDQEIERLGEEIDKYQSQGILQEDDGGPEYKGVIGLNLPYPPLDPDMDRYIFKEMKTPGQIGDAVYELWDRLTLREIEAAFNALKRLSQMPPDTLLDDLSNHVLRNSSLINSRHVASIFHACSRLRYFNVGLFNCLAEEACREEKLKLYGNLHIGMIIYSLGVLQRTYVRLHKGTEDPEHFFPFQKNLVEALCQQMVSQGKEAGMSSQSCGNLIYGLAMLNHKNEALLNLLSYEASRYERLQSFNEQEISNIIYGLGVLQHRNEKLLSAFCSELRRPELLKDFKEQGLSNTVYGFALLHYRPPRETLYALVWELCKEERIKAYANQHLINIIHALAFLGVRSFSVNKVLFDELVTRTRSYKFLTLGLSSAVHSLAKVGIYLEGIQVILENLTKDEIIVNLSEQSISNLLYSFARFPTNPELLVFFTKLLREAIRADHLSKYTEQHFANIIFGVSLSNFSTRVSPLHIGYLIEAATTLRMLRSYTDQGFANIVFGLAKLKIEDVDVNSRVSREYISRLPSLELIPLTTVAYAWGLLKYKDKDALKSLEEELEKEKKLDGASERILSNLLLALIRLDAGNINIFQKISNQLQEPRKWMEFSYVMTPSALAEVLSCRLLPMHFRKEVESCLSVSQSRWAAENRPEAPDSIFQNLKGSI